MSVLIFLWFFFRGSYEKAKSWIKVFFSVFGKMLQWYFFCCKGHDRQLWIIWVGKFYYFYIIFVFNTNKYIFNNIVKKRWCDYRKIARVRSLHTQNFICFNYTSCIPFLHHFPSSLGYKQEFVSTCTLTQIHIYCLWTFVFHHSHRCICVLGCEKMSKISFLKCCLFLWARVYRL